MFLVNICIALQTFKQMTDIYSFRYVKSKIESNQGSTNRMDILTCSSNRDVKFTRALIKHRSTSFLKLENNYICRLLPIVHHVIVKYMYVLLLKPQIHD